MPYEHRIRPTKEFAEGRAAYLAGAAEDANPWEKRLTGLRPGWTEGKLAHPQRASDWRHGWIYEDEERIRAERRAAREGREASAS